MRNRCEVAIERTLGTHPVVQGVQLGAVPVDAEAGHDPHDEAQEVDDGRDVVEHAAQRGLAHVDHLEPVRFGGCSLAAGPRFGPGGRGPRMASASSSTLSAPICCESSTPPGRRTASDAGPRRDGRVTADHEVERVVAEGQLGPVGRRDDRCAERANRPAATGTLGGHDSVAIVRGGSGATLASISPPPVWTSSSASTSGRRAATIRA